LQLLLLLIQSYGNARGRVVIAAVSAAAYYAIARTVLCAVFVVQLSVRPFTRTARLPAAWH